MTDPEIAAALRRINRWRRGDEAEPMPEPAFFGRVLDLAAERLEGLARSRNRPRCGQPLVNSKRK